jgi:hypothetical protein
MTKLNIPKSGTVNCRIGYALLNSDLEIVLGLESEDPEFEFTLGPFCMGPEAVGPFIQEILDVVGVRSWDKLKGKYVRVIREDDHTIGIANIVKNRRLVPREFLRPKDEETEQRTVRRRSRQPIVGGVWAG